MNKIIEQKTFPAKDLLESVYSPLNSSSLFNAMILAGLAEKKNIYLLLAAEKSSLIYHLLKKDRNLASIANPNTRKKQRLDFTNIHSMNFF